MSVEIDPSELAFTRPFTSEVSQSLKIRNPNHTPVAFKVKTTAPKQYCVRPNSGRIEPGKEVEVTVLLQAMKQEPPLDVKCRDKFLVQSVAITADKEFNNTSAIHVDEAERSSVQEKKIRVVYLAQGGASAATLTPVKNGGTSRSSINTPETAPPAYGTQRSPSPEQAAFTPEPRRSAAGTSKYDTKTPTAKSSSSNLASSVQDAVGNAAPMSYEDMKAKLAEAQATIASYAQEGGIRMRKVAQGETSNATVNDVAHHVQGNQGVPLQIVAALCLVSFLLAYVFF
ncbi:uncharacterized protein L3040_001218 [Drepanopeziza brunnea f. sp. 'multigermtubi']|uniref:MSP domain-containing protein n=1 Tax=Marssonina brunnea f. sp. multigermtubi (strain MB_m1) TaxID=1072389 RepID=K1X751_MARBU|nr:MSP domain-containing protein [Drepanopeziza brunnea f. sp. 'multigermtubi' MB_m1]EKD16483.1 MSP domain-containing protein [Drepanopeziza brunnea f. sp. 'multigermtubi' MB_m1]KAJ5051439.1 hypothetical protein L3040_001218 [Drepanopeziza brunnea f. sp. 'multigermtubi']